tara:strand:+ start:289 stop:465 length:177 start_codon:yes stop_codon:yes gene_type:complete
VILWKSGKLIQKQFLHAALLVLAIRISKAGKVIDDSRVVILVKIIIYLVGLNGVDKNN